METLWAPWRMGYVTGEKEAPGPTGCIFCDKPMAGDDAKQLIVARGRSCFVILNLYPYNNGHLMVVPYRHVSQLGELKPDEAAELMQIAQCAEGVLRETMNAQGFNIGMNVGSVAGAGIASHLHLHIVPRWAGDTNFMPVVADAKVMPQSLSAVCELLSSPLQNSMDARLNLKQDL
jgi:ATP adenylyltransferase